MSSGALSNWPGTPAVQFGMDHNSQPSRASSPASAAGASGVVHIVVEMFRRDDVGDPHSFRLGEQHYSRRPTDGSRTGYAALTWGQALLGELDGLRALSERRPGHSAGQDPGPAAGDRQVLGELAHRVRQFLDATGWAAEEVRLKDALAERQTVHITLSLGAAELYSVPWELLTLPPSPQYLGQRPDVLFRYTWPGVTAPAPVVAVGPPRVLLAWSSAGGGVPADSHTRALADAYATADQSFVPGSQVLPEVTRVSLPDTLARAAGRGEPISILHLLCHGVASDGLFALSWTGADGGSGVVYPDQLPAILGEHARSLQVVILSACESAHIGEYGNRVGSVAQAIHRLGVPWVIGSRLPLSKRGSVRFAELFYERIIGRGVGVEDAFLAARSQLASESETLDWASLQLYAAAPASEAASAAAPAPAPAPESEPAPGVLPARVRDTLQQLWRIPLTRWLTVLTIPLFLVLGLYQLGVESHRARLALIGLTDIELHYPFFDLLGTGARTAARLLWYMLTGLFLGSGIERWAAPVLVGFALGPWLVWRRRRVRTALVVGALALLVIGYSAILYTNAVGIHHVAMAEGIAEWPCRMSAAPGAGLDAAPTTLPEQIRHEVCSWVRNDSSGQDLNDGRRIALGGLLGWHAVALLWLIWTLWRCTRLCLAQSRWWSWLGRAALVPAGLALLLLLVQAPRAHAIAHHGLRYQRVATVEPDCHQPLHDVLGRIERGEPVEGDDVPPECTVVHISAGAREHLVIPHGLDCPGQSLDESPRPRLVLLRSARCIHPGNETALIIE